MSSNSLPQYIYHYTSNDALLKILQSQSLRMSARHHLNDTMEGEQFFDLLKRHESNPTERKIEAIKKMLEPYEAFMTCFSSESDLLSQWRGYAGNGTGVAVGFNTCAIKNAIKGSLEALLYPVAYAVELRDLPSQRSHSIREMLEDKRIPSIPAIQAIAKERWAIKPVGFSEEKEFRLIATLDAAAGTLSPKTKGLQISYSATSSEVREYCNFKFGEFPREKFLEYIILGPNNRTDEATLERYLRGIGLESVKVLRSGISYR